MHKMGQTPDVNVQKSNMGMGMKKMFKGMMGMRNMLKGMRRRTNGMGNMGSMSMGQGNMGSMSMGMMLVGRVKNIKKKHKGSWTLVKNPDGQCVCKRGKVRRGKTVLGRFHTVRECETHRGHDC